MEKTFYAAELNDFQYRVIDGDGVAHPKTLAVDTVSGWSLQRVCNENGEPEFAMLLDGKEYIQQMPDGFVKVKGESLLIDEVKMLKLPVRVERIKHADET